MQATTRSILTALCCGSASRSERRFRGSLGLPCDTFILAIVGGSKPTTLSASLSITPLGELASFPTEPTRLFIFLTKYPHCHQVTLTTSDVNRAQEELRAKE